MAHCFLSKKMSVSEINYLSLGDAHCPRQNGVYPSEKPHECDVFYSCLNGVGSPTRCPEGLHYSEKEGICVWARDSGRYEMTAMLLTPR